MAFSITLDVNSTTLSTAVQTNVAADYLGGRSLGTVLRKPIGGEADYAESW
jgi:hypothetical protein